MKRLALSLFIALAAPVIPASLAQSVKLPAEVRVEAGFPWAFIIPTEKEGGDVKWHVGPGLTQLPLDKLFPGQKAAGVVVTGLPRDEPYEVWAWCAKGDVASELAVCKVRIVGVTPAPPPGPTPSPGPGPNPTPQPEPPIPGDGLRVLLLYETSAFRTYSPGHQGVIQNTAIGNTRKYLDTHCVKDSNGNPERRMWDKDSDTSNESKLWQDAFKRGKDKASVYPWLIISNGKTGYEGVVPQSVDEMLTLLKKYGGE